MAFKKINSKELVAVKPSDPTIRFHLHGGVSLSRGATELIGYSSDKPFLVFVKNDSEEEDERGFYIGVSNNKEGNFELRQKEANGKYPTYNFNSVGLVNLVSTFYDMPLSKGKKVSVRMDIAKTPVEHDGMQLYKIY